MTEQKTPAAGEWWQHKAAGRLRIVGRKLDGIPIAENRRGELFPCDYFWSDWHHEPECTGWHHLPDCTGWDWTPPDWVEINDPSHVLRYGIDWVQPFDGEWNPVNIFADCRCMSFQGHKFRCLRIDLPKPAESDNPSPKRTPIRMWVGSLNNVVVATNTPRSGSWSEIMPDGNGGWCVESDNA